MNALAHWANTWADSATMFRRQIRHLARYPSLTFFVVVMPVVFLLLFVYVFGGAIGAGLGPRSDGRGMYLQYLVPGILVMTIAGVVQGTAISVAMDMTGGIVARFRTMSISRSAVLMGHVLGSLAQALLAMGVVLAVAVLIGFRTTTGPLQWLAALGLLSLTAFALTWLTIALAIAVDNVETASNIGMPLVLLPFLGSGFVPTSSMPAPLRLFADYQPFTPIMETLRALLTGGTVGTSGPQAVIWCVLIAGLSYAWAMRLYEGHSVH
jgi:ABC-2 type transport system permease protein